MPLWEFHARQSLLEKEVHWIDSGARRFRGNSIVADLLSVTGSVIALQSSRGCSKTHCLKVFRGSVFWVDLYCTAITQTCETYT